MAELPQVPQTFYTTLSRYMTVEAFSTVVLEHWHANQQPGHIGFFQPTHYRVHRIRVIKEYLFVQHEALVAEIHHIPPGGENAEPAFFVRIDRNIDTGISTIFRKLSIDRTTCSHMAIQPSFYMTLWELPDGLNLLQLAVLLRSVSNLAGGYSTKRHNCFWFTSVVREILQDHGLFPDHQVVIPTATWPFYRLGACLGVRLGIPTANEIQWVRNQYTAYFAQIGNPII